MAEEEPEPERQRGFSQAVFDFRQARQRAGMQSVIAQLTGKSNELLSYEEVAQKLKLTPGAEAGRHDIPLDAIVGSVGRYSDFSRTFLPLHDRDQGRWARVKAAVQSQMGVPPIDVYKVGDVYFVRDGNHRVSVARAEGAKGIEANVIEVHSRVPLTPDVQPDDLILKAEYAEFLEQTHLDEVVPGVDFSLTVPGEYARLKEHVDMHRYFMGLDRKRDISYSEAVKDWYQTVYLPLVMAIREAGLMRGFPGRTETDLYLWVSEHRAELEQELGWNIRPQAAIADLAVRQGAGDAATTSAVGDWRKSRIADRYTERLFNDILVPLSGEPGCWPALDQALYFARREGATVHGLHVVDAGAEVDSEGARAVQGQFNQRCDAAGVPGSLAIEAGEIAPKILERALLTDLVVLKVAHPPGGGLASLGSGLRTIIWRCARPILAVPESSTEAKGAMLAYDGSPKAREALFVGTYLAEIWKTALTVASVMDGIRVTSAALDEVKRYLEFHEVAADLVNTTGPIAETLLALAGGRPVDLLLLGGYGANPVKEVILGSTVNRVLREACCPVFICR